MASSFLSLLALLPAASFSLAPALDAELLLNWCDASSPLQQFTVSPTSVSTPDGTLCFTMAALTLQPCAGLATQNWAFNTSASWPAAFTSATASGDGSCLLWNTQGGPGYESVGSTVGVYACSHKSLSEEQYAPPAPPIRLREGAPRDARAPQTP